MFALVLLGLWPIGVSGQAPEDLRRAIDERAEAIYQARVDVWDPLTADDFTVVRPDGRLMTKAERLAELGTQVPTSIPPVEKERTDPFRPLKTESGWARVLPLIPPSTVSGRRTNGSRSPTFGSPSPASCRDRSREPCPTSPCRHPE